MNYDRLWERLVDALDGWTSAREVEPGRIEVSLPDTGAGERQVQIVMTPDEWVDMASVAFGGFDHAFNHVKDRLTSMEAAKTFAVYSTYDLVSSTTPQLPLDPEEWVYLTFWHRPLHAMADAFAAAGFRIAGISEPPVAPDTPPELIPPGFEGKSFMGFLFFVLVPA